MSRSESKQLFSQAVSAVFREWPALTMAVEQQFGGHSSSQKATWLEEVTAQWFWDNGGIQPSELEDFLATLLDQEFDTIMDDGSLPQVSGRLCELFQQSCSGAHAEVRQFMAAHLKEPTAGNRAPQQQQRHHQDQQQQAAAPQQVGEAPQDMEEGGQRQEEGEGEGSASEGEEGGWEVVCRSRRRQ